MGRGITHTAPTSRVYAYYTNEVQRTLQKENKPFSGSKKLKLNALSFQQKRRRVWQLERGHRASWDRGDAWGRAGVRLQGILPLREKIRAANRVCSTLDTSQES